MSLPTTWAINGVPVERYGLYVSSVSGALDLPARTYQIARPVERDGGVVMSQASSTGERMIKFVWYLQPVSFLDRRNKLAALQQALRGRLEITTVEDPTKVCYGYFTVQPVTPAGRWLVQPEMLLAPTIVCYDPLWYDVTPQTAALPAVNTPVLMPVGTALTRRVTIQIHGAVSSPVTVTMLSLNGTTLATMTLALALTSGEYAEIQCDPDGPSILKYSGGTSTDSISALGATETFFRFDPTDQPMLKIDKGTALVIVTRAYEA